MKTLKQTALAAICLLATATASAGVVSTYDLGTGTAGTVKAADQVSTGWTSTDLTLVNADTTVGGLANNHFYHDGWDTTFNLAKYYTLTVARTGSPFALSNIEFSLEETNSPAAYELRSSADGFSAILGTGAFTGGSVTEFNVDLSSLGLLAAPLELRWYISAPDAIGRAGFANHELPGLGGGLPDVGGDIVIYSNDIPVAGVPMLLAIGLFAFGLRRRQA